MKQRFDFNRRGVTPRGRNPFTLIAQDFFKTQWRKDVSNPATNQYANRQLFQTVAWSPNGLQVSAHYW